MSKQPRPTRPPQMTTIGDRSATGKIVESSVEAIDKVFESIVSPKPYSAPKCSACAAIAPTINGNDNYSRVVRTVKESSHVTRYCKCDYCGNTFKSVSMRLEIGNG